MADIPDPVAELREAAARLTEFAEAAKALTGDGHGEWFPWGVVQDTKWEPWPEPQPVLDDGPFGTGETVMSDGRWEPTGQAFASYAVWRHDQEEDWHEADFFAGPMPEPLARFIASMGPHFALAVAALLDKIAWMGESDKDQLARVGCDEAIAIARAFLGTGEVLPGVTGE
jgi:hypothetical protein